jgi:hypothetical protein
MPYLVRAFPILANKEAQLRMLASETGGPRKDLAARFYRTLGITHESWHLQHSPAGDQLIVITQVDNIERRGEQYAQMNDEYTQWLKARIRSLSGIDPDSQPLGPASEKIYEWNSPVLPSA